VRTYRRLKGPSMVGRKPVSALAIVGGLVAGPLLALGLLYWGWCWGWWGRGNLILQYLLQCNCPRASEATRYPDRTEVVISACEDASVKVSPGGRLIDVLGNPRYFLNLETGERIESPTALGYGFLTDSLLLVNPRGREPYLLDLNTGAQSRVAVIRRGTLPMLDDGTIDPAAILPLLRQAEQVYIISDFVVLVGVDSGNYLVQENILAGHTRDGELAQQFLEENNISYVTVGRPSAYDGIPSHTGTFLSRLDGIHLISTGQRIVESYRLGSQGYFIPFGWVYDDRGVILRSGSVYLLDLRVIYLYHYMPVPQPVLLLKVPEEYLPPAGGG